MKRVLIFLAACAVVAAIFIGGFFYDALLVAPGPDAEAVTFSVENGEGASSVAARLRDTGVIKSAFPFKLYLKLSGQSDAIQAGVFTLQTGMSYSALANTLARAEVEEVQMTIPEGYTLKQIGETVRAAIPAITEEQWNAAVGVDSPFEAHPFVVAAGKPDSVDLEGYLFPDTYRFFADATAEDIVQKMIDTMQLKAGTITHNQLTLASIVEREVRGADEMKMVADIFQKRLAAGMPLQADSTISYVNGKESGEMSTDDLKLETPYNTYLHPGLPPGPISNPGLNAITAVLHPTANPYYYFLTTPEGDVVYARTFDEHVANKQQYLY